MFKKTYRMQNTRNGQRLRAYYLIKFRPFNGEAEPSISNIKNISTTGLDFWTDKPLKEGGLLSVSVCIPPLERNFEAVAQVLRVRPGQGETYSVAVRFLKLSESDRAILGGFIEKLYQMPEALRFADNPFVVKRRMPVGIA